MKAFHFRLEPVLHYRRNRRDICRQTLEELLADDRELCAHRDAALTERGRQLAEMRGISEGGGVAVERIASRRYHAAHLTAQVLGLEHRRALLGQQVEVCRQALVAADRDVKALEKLAEKQLAEHRYNSERAERIALEDGWAAHAIAR